MPAFHTATRAYTTDQFFLKNLPSRSPTLRDKGSGYTTS